MMDKELIERLAREAGFLVLPWPSGGGSEQVTHVYAAIEAEDGRLDRFAELIAEECAKVAETEGASIPDEQADEAWKSGIACAADAIRATFCCAPRADD